MAGFVQQVIVEYRHGSHGFYNGHRTRQYTRVVTAFGFQYRIVPVDVDGRLFHQNGSYRFEGHLEIDVLTVADSSLNTTGAVGTGLDVSVVVVENVILLASFPLSL